MIPPPAMLDIILNLAHYHREHELFYARAPLATASQWQVASQALKALATHWEALPTSGVAVGAPEAPSGSALRRYAGCDDLNAPSATESLGILFMEGEGEPVELLKLKRELLAAAEEQEQSSRWLREAMQGSWAAAEAFLAQRVLAEVLGDRHRIIANNWQMASASEVSVQLLRRAVAVLSAVELTPSALRTDLASVRVSPLYLFCAAELLDQAVGLAVQSALLLQDSEPRWRRFRARVAALGQSNPEANQVGEHRRVRADPVAAPTGG